MNGRPETTIREAYMQASSFLRERAVRDAAAAAELLLCHVLNVERSELFMRWDERFPPAKREEWRRLLERKAAGEPVQYLTGEQWFYGLKFHVTPAVLIPRPETELLAEQVMAIGGRMWPEGRPHAVDVGTGSGAIAVVLAARCPSWRVTAIDISAPALAVARANAELNGVGGRVRFLQGDLLKPLLDENAAVDILVSNPPYVESGDIPGLEREVRDFEPRLALDGGPDGLRFYRAILDQTGKLPACPGLIGFEVGMGQAPAVAELVRRHGGWDEVRVIRDYAGIERHVIGLRVNLGR